MKYTCDVCSKAINEPFYIQIHTCTVKSDESYQNLSFTLDEKNDLNSDLISHLSCWKKLLQVKNNINKKLEVI